MKISSMVKTNPMSWIKWNSKKNNKSSYWKRRLKLKLKLRPKQCQREMVKPCLKKPKSQITKISNPKRKIKSRRFRKSPKINKKVNLNPPKM